MYKRYYDGYNTYSRSGSPYSGEVVIPKEREEEPRAKIPAPPEHTSSAHNMQPSVCEGEAAAALPLRESSGALSGISRIFDEISIDDIILFGVILLVLKDSSDDPMLIIILAVIFISGLVDKD